MDVFTVEADNTERMLASNLDTRGTVELRDWFSYTKPMGQDVKVVARPSAKAEALFSIHAAGNRS
jgi:hypothetical protein